MVTFEAKKINISNFRLLLWFVIYFMALYVIVYGERAVFLWLLSTAITSFIIFCLLRLGFFVMRRNAGGFSFNDEEQKIITKRKHVIPYNKIKTIEFFKNDYLRLLKIDVYLPGFIRRKIPLFFTDTQDEESIITEIKKRFNEEKIKIRKLSKKQMLIINTATIVLGILIPAFCLYQEYYPQLKIFPKQYVQKREVGDLKEASVHSFNGFNFTLPKGFLQKKEKCHQDEMLFYFEDQKISIVVYNQKVVDKFKKEKKFIELLFAVGGIRDDYDLFRSIYYNRLGIFKIILLTVNGEITEIYEVNKNSFKGFLTFKESNIKQINQIATLLLVDKNTHNTISFNIYSQDKIDFRLPGLLINGISIRGKQENINM